MAAVFRKPFDGYNSERGKREFGRCWMHRGNGGLEFAYYRLDGQKQWQAKGRESLSGTPVSETWSLNLANLRSSKPKMDLRFRLQIDPHTTKKSLPNLLTTLWGGL